MGASPVRNTIQCLCGGLSDAVRDDVKSIDPGEIERAFATRIVGPDYCNAGRTAKQGQMVRERGPRDGSILGFD